MEKYFLYVRKSSEDDWRQIQSIPDQIEIMKLKAKTMGVFIIEVFKEEKSAKAPWRPVFNEMIDRIRKWEANGIIAWKLDRLSRNPIDSGCLQYMLQTWELKVIATSDRNYFDVDAWLLFSVESWIWNQFILDLKKNVKRWMDYKTANGVYCSYVPEGYINKRDDKTIIKDGERFDLLRKMWDLMLTWNYTAKQVMNIANNDWWFTRRKTKKRGWLKLQLSWVYKMFNNIFYTGDFMRNWDIKKWTHPPMITYDEFYRVQEMLWAKWIHIRGKKREFSYTWFITCGECGSAITAIEKHKVLRTSTQLNKYVYYLCTKRKHGCENCTQKPIKLEELERQINEWLMSVELDYTFKEWGLEILREDFENEVKIKEWIKTQLKISLDSAEKKLKNLTSALIWELIDEEEFSITKKQLKLDINLYRQKLAKLVKEEDTSIEETIKVFDFIIWARAKFNHGDLQSKKEIFRGLGLNWTLKGGKLHWVAFPWFVPIQNFTKDMRAEISSLELTKNSVSAGTHDAKTQIFAKWCSAVHEVRKAILEHWEKIYLPEFMNN